MSKKVFVGLSGGVDSSVSAVFLKEQGYDVTGVYMKNWSQDLPGFECPWKQDFNDAKRVAVQLDIPFKMYDFEREYRQKVVDYMITEYQAGRTPNPDVMCNQEIKFKLFLDTALSDGADFVATGHYARARQGQLLTARDENKDQTYFLYRVTQDALAKILFPLGDYTKPEVRKLAEKFGLITASKRESMGICFVGKVGIREFLQHELGKQKQGDIIDQNNKKIGRHDGAIFYTIGQRRGLDVGGGLPYYVVGKDMYKNEVYVTTLLDDNRLWNNRLRLTDVHWINKPPRDNTQVQVRTRHRAPKAMGTLHIASKKDNDTRYSVPMVEIELEEKIRALTPGQSAVIYSGEQVLGGGILV